MHSIKGTSGTIQMPVLSALSGKLLQQAEAMAIEAWKPDDLRAFLFPLIKETYAARQHQDILTTEHSIDESEIPADQPLVLILDDDATLLQFLKEELESQGYFVIATVNPYQAIHYFHDLSPDCLILDLIIPEKSGFEVIETLKERISKSFIPTTVISTDVSRATRLKAFEMGADDFLNKPLDVEELLARMKRQMQKKRQLDSLLFIDELTGALNRKYFDEAYKRLCHERQRVNKNFSLAVIDLDRFKQVNDVYGHLVGDKVLAGFTQFLKENIRATDILIRYGGEEFVMLMPQTGEQDAKLLLERLLGQFSQIDFGQEPDYLRVTFSAGVVEVLEADPLYYRKWLEAADFALYQSKQNGRSRIEIGSIGMELTQPARKLNIAIIDDDAIVRAMLLECLKESIGAIMPVEVRTYRDGEIFFADPWHSQRNPFLVILDGIMPKMDGLEVLERIRAMPDSNQYSVIMLTGRSEENDIVRALQLGADDYLTKPFRIGELEARVKRLLRRLK
ncbi:GGDEF domain-containing response regulator [Paenibacillus sp. y28]|uniref:GGDEF domain-containing response regulator n=1 Tax=Paenibacillus sp. y28 TaxID=3129110 RepID=UPI003015CB0F